MNNDCVLNRSQKQYCLNSIEFLVAGGKPITLETEATDRSLVRVRARARVCV